MPTPDLPTDIDATDHAGLTEDDHEEFHDLLHRLYNAPAIPRGGSGNELSASHTLELTDANEVIEFNTAGAVTLTVPNSSAVDFPVGTIINVYQHGVGAVTIAPAGGVNILSNDDGTGVSGSRDLSGQYAEASLRKRFTNGWVLTGALASTA